MNFIQLKELTATNCEQVRKWRNEDISHLRTPYLLTAEMQQDFYKNVICNRNSPHRYWGIYEKDDFVGCVGITSIQWENGIAEVTIILNSSKRGQGIGENAVELALYEGFCNMRLKTIFGECYLCSKAVEFWKKIADKYNAYTTTLPNRKFFNGKFWDSTYFSINVENFCAKNTLQ